MIKDEQLDILDAARVAGVHPSTIYRAIRRGELAHGRRFNKILIRPADLEDFLSRAYVERPAVLAADVLARARGGAG